LSHAVWRRRYGSDPAIVGRRIDVNGRPTIVVGVMPSGFRHMMPPDSSVPDDLEAWLPFNRRFVEGPRGQRYLRVVGRLRDGASPADARADVDRVGREISAANAFYGAAGRRFDMQPLHADSTREVRRPLLVLSAGVVILLLIACVNVGSLLAARAAARAREFAVRSALGAGTVRMLRQHVTESLVLGVAGAALGILVGYLGLKVLLTLIPASLARLQMAEVNLPVVVVSTMTVVAWMTLLALAPAREAFRADVSRALHDDRRRGGGGVRRSVRSALTITQIALSVVLVAFALLLVRTVQQVQQVDAGFDARGILSLRLALPGSRYPNQDAFNAFSRRLQEALAGLPGASGAAAISHAPYDHVPNWGGPYVAREGADPSTAPQADYRAVAPGAMELLGVTLLDGRLFTESDDPRSTPVVIVDDRLARRTWPGEAAVGRRLGVDPTVVGTPSTWATVVGVVRHVRHRSPVEEVREQVYFPSRQVTRNPSVYLVKSGADPNALVGPVRDLLRSLDPGLPIYDVRPLGVYVADARALREFTALLAALFAVAALLLAAVGVYGLIAYSVTERHREFGVRVALGAQSADVMRVVLGDAMTFTGAGVALGLIAAVGGATWLRRELYGVEPWDPAAIGATLGILVTVALLACANPTRRAMRTDPAEALRQD
jgi:putative ABC transport system permease protein